MRADSFLLVVPSPLTVHLVFVSSVWKMLDIVMLTFSSVEYSGEAKGRACRAQHDHEYSTIKYFILK